MTPPEAALALADTFEARSKYDLANATRPFVNSFDYINVRLDQERAAIWAQAAAEVRKTFTQENELYGFCDACAGPVYLGEDISVDPNGDYMVHRGGCK